MPTESGLTPKLIDAIEALLKAIRSEDQKVAQIQNAQNILAELNGNGSTEVPGRDKIPTVDKEKTSQGGGEVPGGKGIPPVDKEKTSQGGG